MDSLTQALLGATVFAAVKHKDISKKALLIGALAGTLPDLDVLLSPLFNDVAFLSVHRSVSHSMLFAVCFGFLLAEIFHRIYGKKHSRKGWILAFFLSIFTHTILDWCTTYGTKLLSPFNGHLFSTNSIHVFEPIYTLILLIGVTAHLLKNHQKTLKYTLVLSSTYILWTFVSKGIANHQFVIELDRQHIEYDQLLVSPTPLNSVLWHGIAKVDNGFYFATYSLFDKRDAIDFYFEESYNDIIQEINENKLIRYYLEYTQDFPLIKKDDKGNIKIYAVKFGPINYFDPPEFVYPLCFNENNLTDNYIKIDYSGKQRGPVKNYRNLYARLKGI